MRFAQIQGRGNPDKVFTLVKNTSGAALAAGDPVFYETDAVTDGHAVSQAVANPVTPAGKAGLLFAGIVTDTIADDGYGEVQTYGINSATTILYGDSGISYAPGVQLIASPGNNYLVPFSASTSAQASPENFVTLMETVASAAANSNTSTTSICFIRAL